MEKITLSAEPRKIVGKKVKNLRKEGLVPANIFGKDLKSKSLQVNDKELRKVFKEAGETGVVNVKVGADTYPVLIHKIQLEPRTDSILHADFHKINLKEKITANVPIVLDGEAPAEKTGIGLILKTLDELEVESLPSDIPHEIKIDISKLDEVGQSINVKDLKVNREKVEVKNDPEETVVSVQTAEMKEEPVEEEKTPEEVEAIAEKGEEEVAEGEEKKEEAPAGEQAPPEGKSEEKPQGQNEPEKK